MSGRETPVKGASTPIEADFSKVALPPEGAPGEEEGNAPAVVEEDVAVITFLDPADQPKEIAFAHPFSWGGRDWRSVTARRMTHGEMLRVSEAAPKDGDGNIALVHFYAAMTGLPASVIRALESDDADRLQQGCYPFLPRSITDSISTSRDAT